MWVVIEDIEDTVVHGPFATEQAAAEWAEENCDEGEVCQVTPVEVTA